MIARPSSRPGVPLLLVSRRHRALSPGVVVSVLVHAALALGFVVRPAEQPERRSLADEFVTFLLPPDRAPGEEDERSDVPWSEVPGAGGAPGEAAHPGADEAFVTLSVSRAAEDAGGDTASVSPAAPVAPSLLDSVLTEFEVDSTVERYPHSAAPAYPPDLLGRGIQGRAFVQFVVDTTGRPDLGTFRVIEATHPGFGRAVRDALPNMVFRPAIRAGAKVRQLVEQSFTFRITLHDTPPGRRPPE